MPAPARRARGLGSEQAGVGDAAAGLCDIVLRKLYALVGTAEIDGMPAVNPGEVFERTAARGEAVQIKRRVGGHAETRHADRGQTEKERVGGDVLESARRGHADVVTAEYSTTERKKASRSWLTMAGPMG